VRNITPLSPISRAHKVAELIEIGAIRCDGIGGKVAFVCKMPQKRFNLIIHSCSNASTGVRHT